MTQLLVATRNVHKTGEFGQLLGAEFSVRDLTAARDLPEIAETGRSFEENATIKALAISKLRPNEIVIADDSGLEVDALGGAPGIFSARYADAGASDRDNVEKLLRELQSARRRSWPNFAGCDAMDRQVKKLLHSRSARFRCVIAVAKNGELLTTVAGEIMGTIAESPRGQNGFGYDPIFVPEGFTQTFAQLAAETKNRISHRARATENLRAFLQNRAR